MAGVELNYCLLPSCEVHGSGIGFFYGDKGHILHSTQIGTDWTHIIYLLGYFLRFLDRFGYSLITNKLFLTGQKDALAVTKCKREGKEKETLKEKGPIWAW